MMGCHTGRARSSCAQCALDLCQQAKERELEALKAQAREFALEIESACGNLDEKRAWKAEMRRRAMDVELAYTELKFRESQLQEVKRRSNNDKYGLLAFCFVVLCNIVVDKIFH